LAVSAWEPDVGNFLTRVRHAKRKAEHAALLDQIKEKQGDGRWVPLEITKDIHKAGITVDPRSGDLTGIGAAIQRLSKVLIIKQTTH
jgi:hypothetical protein